MVLARISNPIIFWFLGWNVWLTLHHNWERKKCTNCIFYSLA